MADNNEEMVRLYAPGITPEGVLMTVEHWRSLRAMVNNGGWTDKPPKQAKVKSKDAANDAAIKGSSKETKK